ncbi:hypothetical protein MTO96_040115 [Rhipicephalus appendiculatus]
MDGNVDGDAATERTDACEDNGANTPMDFTNANDRASVSDKLSDPPDADGADWQLSQTLRQRKKQAQERRSLAALQAQQKQMVNSQKMGPRGQKLPPLPKDDYKIVIRPHQGLPLKAIAAPALARAIIETCDNQFMDEKFILRINRGSNIAILSTKYSEVAELVRKIQQLIINGRPHPVRAYVATGEEAIRGVVHGIQPNTSMETLMAHLRIRTQGVELVQARMIGNTKSAALTFYGDKLPRTLILPGILRAPRDLSQCNCATKPMEEVRNNYLLKLSQCRRGGFPLKKKKKLSKSEGTPLGLDLNPALAQNKDSRQPRRRTRQPSNLARQLHSSSTTTSNRRG